MDASPAARATAPAVPPSPTSPTPATPLPSALAAELRRTAAARQAAIRARLRDLRRTG